MSYEYVSIWKALRTVSKIHASEAGTLQRLTGLATPTMQTVQDSRRHLTPDRQVGCGFFVDTSW